MQFDVVVVGSLNLDLVARVARHPAPGETVSAVGYDEFPGGKGLNQAVAAARSGASVAIVGSVGDDAAGRRLRTIVTSEGIEDRWLVSHATPTGRALITVDTEAENSIVVVPGANALTCWPESPPTGHVMIAQLEVPHATIAEAFRSGRSAGARTILNPAPAADLTTDILEHCSIVVPNEHELALLGGTDVLAGAVDVVVTTRGAQGATIDRRNTSTERIAPIEVTPTDTTGAGDAFCGNLAARLAHGSSITDAARAGAAAGALATTKSGAVPSLPHRADVDAALRATSPSITPSTE